MKYFTSFKFMEIIKVIIFSVILLLLLLLSKNNFESVNNSITLFISSVLPSLFPFIFFTEFLLNTNVIYTLSRSIGGLICKIFNVNCNATPAIIIGFLCGYPMGSKAVSTLYEKGLIHKIDANKLLLFVNNCNPAFILSTVGIGIFYNLNIGFILLLSHYISAILIGILGTRKKSNTIIHENKQFLNSFSKNSLKNQTVYTKKANLFEIVRKSILNSFITLANILGFIILFNLASSIIQLALANFDLNIQVILSAMFEITQGCNKIYNLNINIEMIISLISFMLGFSGFCILAQIYSTIAKSNFSFKRIFISKFIHGIISFVITYILLKITNICNVDTITVFNVLDTTLSTEQYLNNMKISYLISTFIIIFILLIYSIIAKKSSPK